MYIIELNDNPHNFEKQNLVTTSGNFDILKCSRCGILGKTINLAQLRVKGSYSKSKVDNCTLKPDEIKNLGVNERIKITRCTAAGRAFLNLTPGSEHLVIPVPEGNTIDTKGVWVMGNEEPVKVLNNEFNYL